MKTTTISLYRIDMTSILLCGLILIIVAVIEIFNEKKPIMIHEEICTYEVCKLAKEKGFNEKVYHYYQIINKHYCECQDRIEPYIFSFKLETDDCFTRYNKGSEDVISAPTQSLLQRWLREEKEVEVYVRHFAETNKYPHHFGVIITDNKGEVLEIGAKMFDTYELALEDALKYALENLV